MFSKVSLLFPNILLLVFLLYNILCIIFNSFFVIFLILRKILHINFFTSLIKGQYNFENKIPNVSLYNINPVNVPKIVKTRTKPSKNATEKIYTDVAAVSIKRKSRKNTDTFPEQKVILIILSTP